MNDPVSSPSHYDGFIECKDALESAMDTGYTWKVNETDSKDMTPMAFYWWGCAFKYLWRWRRKGGIQDLRKCQQCIDFLIGELEYEN